MFRKLTFAFAALLALAVPALAQNAAPPVQQSAQRADAGMGAAVSGSFNTINTQTTATVTPPAGQYAYITRIEMEACQDATASANVNLAFTSTGLGSGASASPQWGISLPATADLCAYRDVNFATPLKSAIAGQNVTVVSPAAIAHTAYNSKIFYYFSP